MSKTIIAIIILIIVGGLGYLVYYQPKIDKPEELGEAEQACINAGGEVSTSSCCKTTGDFPDLCLIGACGCSPENSHEVKICDCGPDKCFNGSECIFSDEVSNFLRGLKQETGIGFSEIQPVEFKWVVEADEKVEDILITGKGFEADRISSEQYDSIEFFFLSKDFEINFYNIADGTISELVGYKKDQNVCTVAGGAAGYKEAEGQWIPPEPDLKDVEIKCGKTEISEEITDTEELSLCAKEGEQFSSVFKNEYPEHCCEGLEEWHSGMDTRVSIADECYETGLLAGSPVGTCIKRGDGICGDAESPCNCPEDCKGKNKSNFSSAEEFCQSNYWKISLSKTCEETIKDFPICKLCDF